jgi:hypothetical protein
MGPFEPIANGRELVLRTNAAFPGREWRNADGHSGCPRDYVEWRLQEDMVPPEAILTAAGKLFAEAELARDGGGLWPVVL